MPLAIIELVSKLFGFGIDLFVRHREKREALKKNFDEFLKRSNKDSEESAKLHRDYEKLKNHQDDLELDERKSR